MSFTVPETISRSWEPAADSSITILNLFPPLSIAPLQLAAVPALFVKVKVRSPLLSLIDNLLYL